jgi:hypothetical protein
LRTLRSLRTFRTWWTFGAALIISAGVVSAAGNKQRENESAHGSPHWQHAIGRVPVQICVVGPADVIVSPNVVVPESIAAVQLSQLPE